MFHRLSLFCFSLLVFLFWGSQRSYATASSPNGPGLFSWDDDLLENEEKACQLFDTMLYHGLTVLYQYFPSDISSDISREFLRWASQRDISVYLLNGSPDWALDPQGGDMLKIVRQAKKINKNLEENERLAGILMDCEPYLLDQWDERKYEIMESYVDAMTSARRKASTASLIYIACIPFYYDDMGLENQLESLFSRGCDGVAIMNYSKKNEAGHIETELSLAKVYNRAVTVIYELQNPDDHGLSEVNTYYHDGLDALKDSVDYLINYFGRDRFQYALHDYNALLEVEQHE